MRLLLVCFTILLMVGCESFDTSMLIGKWKSTSWIDKTNDRVFDHVMKGEFGKDDRYTIIINERTEVGKYWIFGESLVTVEDGQNEKSVKILKLTPDTLTIEMNRSGQIEEVILIKDLSK